MMRSTWSDSEGVCTSSTGCTDGVGDSGCSCQGTHTSSPIALGITPWVASARRTGAREKVARAASLSHAIACGGTVDTRQISPVVQ